MALVALLGLGGGGFARAASPPVTNGKIAFGAHGLFTIDPDGTHERQIGASFQDLGCFDPTWSPDSTKLAFCWFLPQGERTVTANPDGSDFTLLDPYPDRRLSIGCNQWSPDGVRLLCHWDPDDVRKPDRQGLYTVRSSDGGDLTRLNRTPPDHNDKPLGYSPDGSRILFWRQNLSNDHSRLYTMKSDGTDKLRLSPPGLSIIDADFFDAVSTDWSPDGSRVAFAGFKLNPFRAWLFVVNPDGTGLHRITPLHLLALSAQWSPNGKRIAFTSCCHGGADVRTIRPDGTHLRKLTHSPGGGLRANSIAPVWSPDGTKLLFQRNHRRHKVNLWTMNADGTGLSKLVDIPDLGPYDWGTAPAG